MEQAKQADKTNSQDFCPGIPVDFRRAESRLKQ